MNFIIGLYSLEVCVKKIHHLVGKQYFICDCHDSSIYQNVKHHYVNSTMYSSKYVMTSAHVKLVNNCMKHVLQYSLYVQHAWSVPAIVKLYITHVEQLIYTIKCEKLYIIFSMNKDQY